MTFIVYGSTEHLLECLNAVPLLRRLALISQLCDSDNTWDMPVVPDPRFGIDESMLKHLAAPVPSINLEPKSNSLTLCPFLEEIELVFPLEIKVSVKPIIPFLLSRTTLAPSGVSRLRHAHFYLRVLESWESAPDIPTELGTALEAGLDLRIYYYPDTEKRAAEPVPVFSAKRDIIISQPHVDWKPHPRLFVNTSRY
ncbi:hypothetical protein H0H81_011066 [Sphagnurus paluster]|uniref:Uncharacterized protein n=1 Tax=Sphagnurus paluster TaxID=117069 RepID=A0A9P7GIQ7_9AGAR|nr:hypothetical protein H0H81_011066 [Sphagnurus paluster]